MTQVSTALRSGPEGSAETWRTTPPTPRVPAELDPPRTGSALDRLRAWRRRHLLREQRAREYFDASRQPERGLPVADRHAVGNFFASLLRARKPAVATLLILHALAAIAGLVVP
ncbi:MAG TPA: ABC transporter ATP-binding protein, partial [Propionibacteriaceae bacterium]|nr:ABC transporter ATP-binding protein [Propionibacteriaceae bacterium]